MKKEKKRNQSKGILLSDSDLQEALKRSENWKVDEGKLQREYTFGSFIEAFSFLTGAAILSESMNHRLELYNLDRRVVVKLQTTDLNGISTIDVLLAKRLDQLFNV